MNPHVPINSYQHFADLVSSVSSLLVLFLCFLDYFAKSLVTRHFTCNYLSRYLCFEKDILKKQPSFRYEI